MANDNQERGFYVFVFKVAAAEQFECILQFESMIHALELLCTSYIQKAWLGETAWNLYPSRMQQMLKTTMYNPLHSS